MVEHLFSKHEALGSNPNTETPGKVSWIYTRTSASYDEIYVRLLTLIITFFSDNSRIKLNLFEGKAKTIFVPWCHNYKTCVITGSQGVLPMCCGWSVSWSTVTSFFTSIRWTMSMNSPGSLIHGLTQWIIFAHCLESLLNIHIAPQIQIYVLNNPYSVFMKKILF